MSLRPGARRVGRLGLKPFAAGGGGQLLKQIRLAIPSHNQAAMLGLADAALGHPLDVGARQVRPRIGRLAECGEDQRKEFVSIVALQACYDVLGGRGVSVIVLRQIAF